MDSAWEGLVDALAACNFYASGGSDSLEFEGFVDTENFGRINLSLVFESKACIEFPVAKSKNAKIKELYRKIPHINWDGTICYVQKGSIVFDALNPLGMIRFVLDQVKNSVLDAPKEGYAEQFTREITSYWDNEMGPVVQLRKNGFALITYSKNPLSTKVELSCPIFLISHNIDFSVLEYPFTKKEGIIAFGKMSLGQRKFRKLKKMVLQNCFAKNQFGLVFKKDDCLLGMIVSPSDKDDISCLSFVEDRQKKLFSRRAPMDKIAPLQNKKILVVGCGTLGSNLLPMLVKSGAGFGQTLTLVDSDIYKEENFSRHYLGLSVTGKNKAEAMKDALMSQNSSLKIEAITQPFQNAFGEVQELLFDLIIDTTGDEALSNYLNRRLVKVSKMPLYVCAYIYGQSQAVCASVQKSQRKACLQCVNEYVKNRVLLPKLKEDQYTFDSCNSVYIPFPITASISAGNLVMTALFKALKKDTEDETIFWYQKCDDHVWGAMERVDVPKDESCLICRIS